MQLPFPLTRPSIQLKNRWLLPVIISLVIHVTMFTNFQSQKYEQSLTAPSVIMFSTVKSSTMVEKPIKTSKGTTHKTINQHEDDRKEKINQHTKNVSEGKNNDRKNIPIINAKELGKLSISPRYPRRAIEFGWQGRVVILVKIINGIKHEVKLQLSSGYRMLDDSALNAVQNWNIPQNIKGGEYWLKIPIEFEIK